MPPRRRRKRLIRPLHDALRSDVNPTPRRHLPVHGEPQLFQRPELLPGRPPAHQVGVRNQHPRRLIMRAEDAHRPARLHQQRLVVFQPFQLTHNRVKRRPVPCRPARAPVNHQILRPFRHLRIQIVHQHPQGGLLRPAFRAHCPAPGGSHRSTSGTRSNSLRRSSPRSNPDTARLAPRP